MAEMELYRDERHIIEYLALVNWLGAKYDGALERRLRTIPNGWRDWRLVRAVLKKLLASIYTLTMSPRDQRRMDERLRGGEVTIRARSVVSTDYSLIEIMDLDLIATVACRNECAICMKEGREIKQCKLRGAFMRSIPPGEPGRYGCEFREIAGDLEK